MKKRSKRVSREVRYVQIVQAPGAKAGTAAAELNRDLVREAKSAEDLVQKSLQKLSNATSRTILDVGLSSRDLFADDREIGLFIRQFDGPERNARSRLRACLFFTPAEDTGPTNLLQRSKMSHLVAIKIADRNGRWRGGKGATSVVATVALEYCRYLLHDIALDIAMYHSWPELRGLPLLDRIRFSRSKALFAASLGTSTLYGTSAKESFGYFSLASFCWDEGAFDVKKYIELWDEFMKGPFGAPFRLRIPPPPDFVEQIFSGNRLRGQIDATTLERKLRALTPGEYAVVTSTRRPKLTKVRQALAGLFSKREWSRNMSNVVAAEKAKDFVLYRDYVEIYHFTVPGTDE